MFAYREWLQTWLLAILLFERKQLADSWSSQFLIVLFQHHHIMFFGRLFKALPLVVCYSSSSLPPASNPFISSIGRGNMMVEFFSADIVLRVCRYRSWSAEDDIQMMSEASLRARDDNISPSAAITWDQENTQLGSVFTITQIISDWFRKIVFWDN